MSTVICRRCYLGKASPKRWGGGFGIRQAPGRMSQVLKAAGREPGRSRSRCTEVGTLDCVQRWGLLQIWRERGWESVTRNRTASSPSSQFAPPPPRLPGPLSTCLCPDSFVRTAPPRTPTPALGTQGILAMCPALSAGRKAAKEKGKASLWACGSRDFLVFLSHK